MVSLIRHVATVLVALASWPALAQAPQCDAWRRELSQLERGGGGAGSARAAQAAQRAGAELSRAQAAFASLQCDGVWVFQPAPPQCGALRGQIGQLRAQYQSLQQQAGGGSENRRRALMAALNDNCRPGVYRTEPVQPQPAQPRTLFEALFGVPERPREQTMPELDGPRLDPFVDPDQKEASWGSGRPVCVRTCDGFFFPLANSPGGRGGQADMCQALCPAAETEVFYMAGDGNIENASRRGGGTYAGLPNAGKYLRQFDASCSCRKQGQSWAQALASAEEMLDRRRGDVIVTEKRAEEMSRPRLDPRARREDERTRRQQAAAPAAADAADAAAAKALEEAGRNAPTAGVESSGIGPRSLDGGLVGAHQGERRELVNSSGEKRTVRIVAPTLSPVTE
jgi:Protein of unknown function (DUF2865)